jgi:hypothetical protein
MSSEADSTYQLVGLNKKQSTAVYNAIMEERKRNDEQFEEIRRDNKNLYSKIDTKFNQLEKYFMDIMYKLNDRNRSDNVDPIPPSLPEVKGSSMAENKYRNDENKDPKVHQIFNVTPTNTFNHNYMNSPKTASPQRGSMERSMEDDELTNVSTVQQQFNSPQTIPINQSTPNPPSYSRYQGNHEKKMYNQNYAVTASKMSIVPPATIDITIKPPKFEKLKLMDVSPHEYLIWRSQMLIEIKGYLKYQGIIDVPPDESWQQFKQNNTKYIDDVQTLESHYLSTHRMLWSMISKSIPNELSVQLHDEMLANASKYNLSVTLNFTRPVPSFFENSYELLKKLDDKYAVKTYHRYGGIMDELRELKYSGKEDPKSFFIKYKSLVSQCRILLPEYREQNDQTTAVDILCRMPKSIPGIQVIVDQFYNRDKLQGISTKEIEESLSNWWIKNKPEKVKELIGKSILSNSDDENDEEESQKELISSFVNYVNNNYKGKFKGKYNGNTGKYKSTQSERNHTSIPYNTDKKLTFGEQDASYPDPEELSNNDN